MKASDLQLANKQRLAFIVSQAELRLAGQMQFATAADQRSATVSSAATALATLSFGIAAQAAASGKPTPFNLAAASAGIGFAVAAWFALQSAKCQDFHPSGFYPENFVGDVRSRKRTETTQREIAEDLNERLHFNAIVLSDRGKKIELAVNTMFGTPLLGAAVFLTLKYGGALSRVLLNAWRVVQI